MISNFTILFVRPHLNRDRPFANASVLCLIVFLLLYLMTGCASSSPTSRPPTPKVVLPEAQRVAFAEASDDAMEHTLRAEIDNWIGVPHKLGGTSHSGVDCSGLVYTTYQNLFGLSLPRVTSDQIHQGTAVNPSELRAGDLVFFRISRETLHVGIFLCCGKFAHASSSQGVTISSIDNPYWSKRYLTARRVLSPSASVRPGTQTGSSSRDRGKWR